MCTHNNHSFNNNQDCHQGHCCSHQLFLSKRKKLEMLNNCLNCTQEKEADIKEVIAELKK